MDQSPKRQRAHRDERRPQGVSRGIGPAVVALVMAFGWSAALRASAAGEAQPLGRGNSAERSTADLTLDAPGEDDRLRVAMFNIRDLRLHEIADPDSDRMRQVAELVRLARPDVLVVQEIVYDGVVLEGTDELVPGRSAEVLADRLGERLEARTVELPRAGRSGQGDDAFEVTIETEPMRFRAFMWPSNTGVPSGLDLDRNGRVGTQWGTRDYGGDALGYGEFPGQYAMAVLVSERFLDRGGEVLTEFVRTFADVRWRDMPGALLPSGDGERVPAGEPWFTDEMLDVMRLSSKSHWDVPVRLPNGEAVHVLVSHPTPPVFDGPEDRNGRRNHDEVRFWAEYLGRGESRDDRMWIVDDAGTVGGVEAQRSRVPADRAGRRLNAVIVGDLNADPEPEDGRAGLDPVGRWLFETGLVEEADRAAPVSVTEVGGIKAHHTATFGRRVDYILPVGGLRVAANGQVRSAADVPAIHAASTGRRPAWTAPPVAFERDAFFEVYPSDHMLLWADLELRPRIGTVR